MIIDCHTHQNKSEADLFILNTYPESDNKGLSSKTSCGIHPWYLHPDKTELWLQKINEMCFKNQISAIGECGLDKNIKDVFFQKEVFKRQIQLSEQYQLPCIIHSVKTHHLLIEMRKLLRAKQPWVVHGYNGSIEMANQFFKQNIFVSFGENLLKHPDKYKKLLNQVDIDFILLETDDSNISIHRIYEQAACFLGLSRCSLEHKIKENFNRVFGA